MTQPTTITVTHEPGGRLPNGTPNGIGGRTTYWVNGVAYYTPAIARVAALVADRGITYVSPLRAPAEEPAPCPPPAPQSVSSPAPLGALAEK